MPLTGQRRTRRSEGKREALLAVCQTLRTQSIQKSARAMARASQPEGSEQAQSAHWQVESARWEAEAAAATAREAAMGKVVSELSQQNRELARKLSQAQCDVVHLRNVVGLQAPQAGSAPPVVPKPTFDMPPRLKLADSQPKP